MKAIITAFIFPMQKRNHKAAMNLFPQGHTASTVVEKKTATAVLLSFVPSYQGSLLPSNSTFAHEIIWNGILSSEGKTTWLINHRDQSMKIFVRPDPSPCKCMMLEVKGDGWWNDKCQCLSNAVKPRSKEMLWLVVRLMAHDLPWKFFSERYWSCLIKRAILVPTSASTCTDTKGEVPCKPMRDAAQLVASEPFHWSVIWAPQLGQATLSYSSTQNQFSTSWCRQFILHGSKGWKQNSSSFLWHRKSFSDETGAFWASRLSVKSKRQGSVQEEHDGERERGKEFVKCPKHNSCCRTLSFFLLSPLFNTHIQCLNTLLLAKCEYMFMRWHGQKTDKHEMPVSSFPSLYYSIRS